MLHTHAGGRRHMLAGCAAADLRLLWGYLPALRVQLQLQVLPQQLEALAATLVHGEVGLLALPASENGWVCGCMYHARLADCQLKSAFWHCL